MLIFILLSVFAASILSLFGGVIMLVRHKSNFDHEKNVGIIAFAGGALLATAFFDLIPEAITKTKNIDEFSLWIFAGVITMFILEKTLLWYHHHHEPHNQVKPAVWLITIGDSIHNFLDGVAVSAAFLTSPVLGVTTALAVFLHEIPHELVDFGILLSHGASKTKTLLLNLLSACAAIIGALVTYYLGTKLTNFIPILLAFAAGNFIYITLADLLPELNSCEPNRQKTVKQIALFVLGIILIRAIEFIL